MMTHVALVVAPALRVQTTRRALISMMEAAALRTAVINAPQREHGQRLIAGLVAVRREAMLSEVAPIQWRQMYVLSLP